MFFLIHCAVEIHMLFNRPYEELSTPQQYQSQTREALRRLNTDVDESPRCCRVPATRPETPTPQPGAAERARMNSRHTAREIRNNDLQDSPRRRRPRDTQDENFNENSAHGLSGGNVLATRDGLGSRVRSIKSMYAMSWPQLPYSRSPLLLF